MGSDVTGTARLSKTSKFGMSPSDLVKVRSNLIGAQSVFKHIRDRFCGAPSHLLGPLGPGVARPLTTKRGAGVQESHKSPLVMAPSVYPAAHFAASAMPTA